VVWAITLVIGVLSAQLRSQAETDALTGTLNRQGLARAARKLIALGERTESLLTVAILDLDGFKAVNDTLGHAAGDRLLAETVAAWRDGLRASDVLARPGGDEFVLLLPATGRSGAARVLDRLRAHSPSPFSHGLATVAPGETLESALARADRDLYRAKAARPVSC
jgi:diguanylate cyclase (GGDEF)-like protein